MFTPTCELLEERVVPCVKAVVCPPPPTCHVNVCHVDTGHHDKCQPVQHCNDTGHNDKCQPTPKNCDKNDNHCPATANGNAQPTDIHYIINGKTDVTSLNSSNLKSGDTVKVEFTVAKGSEPTTFSFVSYSAPNGNFNEANLEGQKIYDSQEVTTGCNGGTYCLTVKVPCDYFQVDFVRGCPISHFTPTDQYHAENRYFGGTQGGQAPTCTPPVNCDHGHDNCDHKPPVCDDDKHCDNHKPVCDDHGHKPPVNDCKPPEHDHCLDNYFCHDDCCDHECVTNITNNYYNTVNNYYTTNNDITNNYNVVNQPPANYYYLPGGNTNNNQQFFSNNSETTTVMANTGYSSTGGTAPNIHDMQGPTVMGGTDDVTPSHDTIQKFLHPNGDGGGFKLEDDSQQQPCTPCLPAPSPFDACFPQYSGCGRR